MTKKTIDKDAVQELLSKSLLTNFDVHEVPMVERALLDAGTEHSVALAFAQRYTDQLKYDHHSNKWLQWTGHYWAVESTGVVSHYCRELASRITQKLSAQRSGFVKGVETFCKNDPIFSITSAAFDMDNYLLNTPGGTIDLRTGATREHDPKDLITNITGCAPGDGYGFRFPQFLQEITCGNEELENYLQVALGACLSGAIESHWLQFWVGTGRNGKNTLGDAVMRVMGSYARKIPSSTLMKTKFEGHPTEIANLKGCRLAVASEVESGSYWSESKVNELTGDTRLSARYMRGDLFEFDRTCKFLIYGNHRPKLNSVTPALQSRIKMVRFAADFTGVGTNPPPDPDLPEKLKAEDGNILRWLIDGHLEWIRSGKKLPVCQAVEDEGKDYVENQATVENWIAECLDTKPPMVDKDWGAAKSLYNHYKSWKQERYEHPVGFGTWTESMVKKYGKSQPKRHANAYPVRLPELWDTAW